MAVLYSATAPRRADTFPAPTSKGPPSTTARAVADQLAVPYVARSGSAPLAAALPDGGTENEPTSSVAAARVHTETYWVPALVAAILILIELYFVLRDFRRTRLVSVDVVP